MDCLGDPIGTLHRIGIDGLLEVRSPRRGLEEVDHGQDVFRHP